LLGGYIEDEIVFPLAVEALPDLLGDGGGTMLGVNHLVPYRILGI
jgi:hypothetical protein